MKDYPIGTVFTNADGVRLEVVESNECDGCYYLDTNDQCPNPNDESLACLGLSRNDGKSVIFRRAEPLPVCHFTQRNKPQ